MEKEYSSFNEYLESIMTPNQMNILRHCLKLKEPIHISGQEGSGKSCLVNGLKSLGFKNITETYDEKNHMWRCNEIPLVEGLTVLVLKDSKANFKIRLSPKKVFERYRDELLEWVYELHTSDFLT